MVAGWGEEKGSLKAQAPSRSCMGGGGGGRKALGPWQKPCRGPLVA